MSSTLTPLASRTTADNVDLAEIRTEAVIILRTVEHITFDVDRFSRSIRTGIRRPNTIDTIENHLGQARRNCADATTIAEEILERVARLPDLDANTQQLMRDSELLRDAFAQLALADSAYLHAFEIASRGQS